MKKFIFSLQQQKQFRLKSQGSSMLPILQPNDVIYYRKISFEKIKVNNIVLARKNNHLFTHRVIFKTNHYIITKGDNNLESDGRIYPKQVITKVTGVKRNSYIFNPESIYLLQSTLYFQEIVKIKKIFEREKIDFVFLKGLPLHLFYEQSHPRRLYLDCDVLVNPKDFIKAERIMFAREYTKAKTELSSSHKKIKDKEIENAYYKTINGFQVVFDLHVEVVFMMTQLGELNALYPQSLIDQLTKEFIKTKRQSTINNQQFSILNTEYLILYLSLHFFHHNFRGAFRLEFLDKVIRKTKMQQTTVKYLTVMIKQYRLQNFVYPVFFLLKKYYQTSIPNTFLKSIQSSHHLSSKIYHLESICDDEPRITAGINRFKYLFLLSPNPLWKRFFVFANPQVVYTIFWFGVKRIRALFNLLYMCFQPQRSSLKR